MVTNTFPTSLLKPAPELTEIVGKLFIPVSHCPLSHSEILNSSHHPYQPRTALFIPKDSWHMRRDITDQIILPMWVLQENIHSKKLEKNLLYVFKDDFTVLEIHLAPLFNTFPSTCKTGHIQGLDQISYPLHGFLWFDTLHVRQ